MSLELFLVQFAAILITAKLCGELAERLKQPAVLGELIGGVLLGGGVLGVAAHHMPWLQPLVADSHQPMLALLGQVGAILLMFEAGLASDVDVLLKLGIPALWVACCGVALSLGAGFWLLSIMGFASLTAVYVSASLVSTSVGISARSFHDFGVGQTKEAQVVLGAAVADDIIGLIVLTVVAGVVTSTGHAVHGVAWTAFTAIAFVMLAIVVGRKLAPTIMGIAARMQTRAALSTAALIFCLVLAALSATAGLSPIIGAFAAGLVLAKTEHKVHFEDRIKPVADVFMPMFFVLAGAAMPIQLVNLSTPAGRSLLVTTLLLCGAAVVSKILAGLSVPLRRTNRFAVGIGMIPRGEVSLIFAAYGLSSGLLTPQLYSAVLLLVMMTALVTPPLLKLALRAGKRPPALIAASDAAQGAIPAIP